MNPSPVGKPSITARSSPTPHGKLSIRSGHGTGYAQETSKSSFTGGKHACKKFTDIHTGHGTEIGPTTSRG